MLHAFTAKVTALELAELDVDRSLNCYLTDMGTIDRVPVKAYLVDAGGYRYLVDTGAPDEDYCRQWHRALVPGSRRDLVQVLLEQGADSLDGVILTHLHWDHAGNLDTLDPAVPVFVQRTELAYAVSPLPLHRRGYDHLRPGKDHMPPWADRELHLLDGDSVLAGGIRLIHTPGHSPGSQCVLVREHGGELAALAGDTVPTVRNWADQIPCGIHVSIADWYASMRRLREVATAVYPGHGDKVHTDSLSPASSEPPGYLLDRGHGVRQHS